jgi:hypothetical protein
LRGVADPRGRPLLYAAYEIADSFAGLRDRHIGLVGDGGRGRVGGFIPRRHMRAVLAISVRPPAVSFRFPVLLVAAGDQAAQKVASRLGCSRGGRGASLRGGGLAGFALFATVFQLIADWRRHPEMCRIAVVGLG